jgi:hypothetical protein
VLPSSIKTFSFTISLEELPFSLFGGAVHVGSGD